jgi:cytoskeletal protein RodZ
MAELGNTLSRARRARGITLEDAERDTHVSRRYLQALENEDFSAFPAPVYARGFLRTYSRYLGLNPEELVRVFPNEQLTVDITPLPTISRPVSSAMTMNWLVAGAVAVFLLGAAFLLFSAGSDPAGGEGGPRISQTQTSGPVGAGQQVIQPPPAATTASTQAQGRALTPPQPGMVPDLIGADEAQALALLRDNQLAYVVITVPDSAIPRGLVVSQTPEGGSRASEDTSITLLVSQGP